MSADLKGRMDEEDEEGQSRWARGGGRFFRIVGMVVAGLVMAVVFAFFFGWFVKLLWNWLMPALFGLAKITFWQAFGLVLLAKLLFTPGISPSPWKHWKGRHGWDRLDWKPNGSHANWRHYGRYWKERGKEDFESWLTEQESPSPGKRPSARTRA